MDLEDLTEADEAGFAETDALTGLVRPAWTETETTGVLAESPAPEGGPTDTELRTGPAPGADAEPLTATPPPVEANVEAPTEMCGAETDADPVTPRLGEACADTPTEVRGAETEAEMLTP